MTDDETLPRRFLRPLLLLALGQHQRSYGYELAESVRGHGLQVDMAGVYRDLRAMEQHELVTSAWEPSSSGPHRRVYELTDDGRIAAGAARDELEVTARLLTDALERLAPPPQVQR